MKVLIIKSIDEEYEDLQKGRGPDKQPRKKKQLRPRILKPGESGYKRQKAIFEGIARENWR